MALSVVIGVSSSISMYSALLVGPTPSGMAKDMTILWCIPSSYFTGISVRLTALCKYRISSRCPMNFMGPYLANLTLTRKDLSPFGCKSYLCRDEPLPMSIRLISRSTHTQTGLLRTRSTAPCSWV